MGETYDQVRNHLIIKDQRAHTAWPFNCMGVNLLSHRSLFLQVHALFLLHPCPMVLPHVRDVLTLPPSPIPSVLSLCAVLPPATCQLLTLAEEQEAAQAATREAALSLAAALQLLVLLVRWVMTHRQEASGGALWAAGGYVV